MRSYCFLYQALRPVCPDNDLRLLRYRSERTSARFGRRGDSIVLCSRVFPDNLHRACMDGHQVHAHFFLDVACARRRRDFLGRTGRVGCGPALPDDEGLPHRELARCHRYLSPRFLITWHCKRILSIVRSFVPAKARGE